MHNRHVLKGLLKILFLFCFFNLTRGQGEEAVAPQIYPPIETLAPSLSTNTVSAVVPALKKRVILPLNEDEKSPDRKSYQVKRGDTLWKISKNTGVTVLELKRFNHLKNDRIQVGQHLILEDNPMEIRRAIPVVKAGSPADLKVSDLAPPSVEEIPYVTPSVKSEKPKTPGGVKAVPATISLKERFLVEVRKMVADRVHYNKSWRPEGSSRDWVMDCSNTTRFLFHKLFKLDIGRTASEQYYRLKLKGQAWEVPMDSKGRADIDYLQANLKEGDLLFWEHTYSPDREPPITHVTVYLGTDEEGRFLMVGSEQGKGLLDASFNGPDLYYFNPLALKGGHHQFLFFGWKPGRFVAHGRPLIGG